MSIGRQLADVVIGPEDRERIPVRGEVDNLKKGDIERIVLGTAALVGIAGMAILAPNAIQALAMFGGGRGRRRAAYVQSVAQRLLDKGYLREDKRGGYTVYRITPEGERYLEKERLQRAMRCRQTWDRKWRVVIFDVREYKRTTREKLREQLRAFGFTLVQQSVWVSPHPCEEIIALVKAELKLGREVAYFEAVTMCNEDVLKRKYKLA